MKSYKVQKIDISSAMKNKYMAYALSVIVGRALPDVRDGMKPVHRRIIYEMGEMGLINEKGFKKSARIVGNVLGKFHPHGDSSVYGAMVRLAQDFNMRHVLIDGHGNWGSIDGDSPAHYRYTEAKMSPITSIMLKDINKNTVDFIPNYDGEESEPTVLPSGFPCLIVNGSEGIAVGFATAIPPHNLKEAIDCVIHQIDNPDCSIEDLVDILKAPDFPTSGQIINPQDMLEMYTVGHGSIKMRSKYHIEIEGKTTKIIFTEIPYQVNKAKLVDEIYSYTVDKIVEKQGKKVVIDALLPHVEVRDESDREGMRICLDLKRNSDVNSTLAILFLKTKLQCNYSANFTAVYKGTQLLEHISLKDINVFYINHQKEVLTRRVNFDLDKSRKRLHILEGLTKATLDIDKTISLIKSCKSKSEARDKLIGYLQIDEEQSNAILQLQLHKLTGMELDIIQNEFNEITTLVKYLESLLNDEYKLLEVLKSELIEIRDKYGDDRRTQLVYEDNMTIASKEDLIENNTVTICLSKEGYIKRNLKYSETQEVKDGDEILQLHQTNNKSDLLLFTSQARMYIRKTYEIAEKLPSAIGEYLPNIIDLLPNEKVIYVATTNTWNENLICVFKNGKVSKMNLLKSKPQQNRKVALEKMINLESELMDIQVCSKDEDILFISSELKGLITNLNNFNAKSSKNMAGDVGMKIAQVEGNEIAFAKINPKENLSFIINTQKGKSKEIYLDDLAEGNQVEKSWYDYLKSQSRGVQGNFIINTRKNNDKALDVIVNK